ncbi:MAG: flagellar motor switch phosphatase FliY [Lachnospiraceae bacterium]|nr:flagellar motor switch phosphatase FliY [Lachnospiraceae bacterium]
MGEVELTLEQQDALGEMSNISMGSSATALSALLMNRRVEITTPKVEVIPRCESLDDYEKSCILVHINYIKGLEGSNILLLQEDDVKRMTDMMMGGDGSNFQGELTDMHLSAVSEAMNQMMGSAATALSKMLNRSIDISPPKTNSIDVESVKIFENLFASKKKDMVKVTFRLAVGDYIDSSMVQLYPIELARQLVAYFYGEDYEQ